MWQIEDLMAEEPLREVGAPEARTPRDPGRVGKHEIVVCGERVSSFSRGRNIPCSNSIHRCYIKYLLHTLKDLASLLAYF